jgi:prolipoprotein diacylglyceryltransferase
MRPFHFVIFGVWLGINLLICKSYRISRLRAGLYTLTFVYAVIGALIGGFFYRFILEFVTGSSTFNLVAIFGGLVFTPVFVILTVLIEKAIRSAINKKNERKRHTPFPRVSVRDTLDMLTPGCLFVLAAFKLGCHFDKCCYGIPWSWGVYSPYLKTTVFPVQIAEFLSILLVLIICLFLQRKPFFRRGMAYPLAVVFYSVFRFGWEFLRWNEPEMRHVILGMTLWQFCCIIVFITSVISLFVLYKTQPSEPRSFVKPFTKKKKHKQTAEKKAKKTELFYKKPEKKPIIHSKKDRRKKR